jgi:hypothetical protein
MSRRSHWSLSFRCSCQHSVRTPLLSHSCYMSCPIHHSTYVQRGVILIAKFIMQLPPPVHYFIPQNLSLQEAVEARKLVRRRDSHTVRSKHSRHPFLKHPHSTKSSLFWDIAPCSPLKVTRRFWGARLLHLQGRRINEAGNQHEAITVKRR